MNEPNEPNEGGIPWLRRGLGAERLGCDGGIRRAVLGLIPGRGDVK